ncbi:MULTISPECIES: hypothetical protein [Sphingobacterium]|uniref:hypothetical protein n=1 Tax=Sphingobacterium TaxID=28453 RepID=UPI000B940EEF|nr:hypothetical protein [Sphingobacterium mizutaii]OYD42298.1 hypothetical protein CHT99_10345 [Sphingobacterium cellulitidis]
MSDVKQDMIDRKVDGVVKIFGLAYKDIVALVATISILLNVYLVYKIITMNEDLNAKIVEEVRRQVPQAVNERVPEVVDSRLEGVREGVDKALNKVDTIVQRIGGKE